MKKTFNRVFLPFFLISIFKIGMFLLIIPSYANAPVTGTFTFEENCVSGWEDMLIEIPFTIKASGLQTGSGVCYFAADKSAYADINISISDECAECRFRYGTPFSKQGAEGSVSSGDVVTETPYGEIPLVLNAVPSYDGTYDYATQKSTYCPKCTGTFQYRIYDWLNSYDDEFTLSEGLEKDVTFINSAYHGDMVRYKFSVKKGDEYKVKAWITDSGNISEENLYVPEVWLSVLDYDDSGKVQDVGETRDSDYFEVYDMNTNSASGEFKAERDEDFYLVVYTPSYKDTIWQGEDGCYDVTGPVSVHISINSDGKKKPKPTPTPTPSKTKNRTSGCTPCAEMVGEPVQTGTGEYFTDPQIDINLGGPLPLMFIRYYASRLKSEGAAESSLGDNWMHNFDLRLKDIKEDSLDVVYSRGKIISFKKSGSDWKLKDEEEEMYQLEKDTSGDFYLMDPSQKMVYHFEGTKGYLEEIIDRNGNTLTITSDSSGKINEISDGLGRILNLGYDSSGNLTEVSDGTRTLTYGYTDSVLTEFTDLAGNTTTYVYDDDSTEYGPLMIYTIYPGGNRHHIQSYDSKGRVSTQEDSFGNTYTFEYGKSKKNQSTVENPQGNKTKSTYDDQKIVTKSEDAMGNTSKMEYDDNDRPISLKDRIGNTTTRTYDSDTGMPASITNAGGEMVNFTSTTQSQTIGSVVLNFSSITRTDYPDKTYEEFEFDSRGNMVRRIDRAGNTWLFTYNSRGQILTETNPEGGVITYTYNSDGTLATSADSDTGINTYEYDSMKRLTKVTHSDGMYNQIAYDANDNITSRTLEHNKTISYAYDANGNLTTITDNSGNTVRYEYDAMDRKSKITNSLGGVTTVVYDEMGKVSSMVDPNGNTSIYKYNENGWKIKETDGERKVWEKEYNNEGLLESETTPLGNTRKYEEDFSANITKITDAAGNVMKFSYDSMSHLTSSVDALGREIIFSYDELGKISGVTMDELGETAYKRNKLGKLTSFSDLNGKEWSFDYTDMGRLSSQKDPLGNEWGYTYDTRGRLSVISNPASGTQTLSYDNAWNLITTTCFDGTTFQYSYDSQDRMTSANYIALSYDAEGNVTATSDGDTSFGATYDSGERLNTVTYNNGTFTVSYTYDKRDLLKKVSDNLTHTTINFTYDDDGRLTTLSRSNGIATTYSYDKAGRVAGIQDGTIANQSFTLNAVGEIIKEERELPLEPSEVLSLDPVTLSYDDASQISASGYTYDHSGRQTSSPAQTLTWDATGRLVSADSVTLEYNGLNNLRMRTENGTTIHYYYNFAINSKPIMAEKNEDTGKFLRYYVWTPAGELLYMIDTQDENAVYFYHFDRVGSSLFLTDTEVHVSDSYAYTPCGVMLQHNGSNAQPFTYIGKYGVRQEGAESLYHMRERYYDAVTGRFLSRDPSWPRIMQPIKLNPYQYAEANPVNRNDPDGKDNESGDSLFWRTVAWYSGKGTIYDKIWGSDIERKPTETQIKEAELEAMGEAALKDAKQFEKLKKEYLENIMKRIDCIKRREFHAESTDPKHLQKLYVDVSKAKNMEDIKKAQEAKEKAEYEEGIQNIKDLASKKVIEKIPGVDIGNQIADFAQETEQARVEKEEKELEEKLGKPKPK